ncbi:MAG TPA: PadR family transcriptional regulator [Methanocella sp.]|nr:PadR family transcriptional regulator [Methanocella sp.]
MWWDKDWNKSMFKNINKLRRWGGMRYVVLYALSESPKNGAEIMETVERMSMGAWRPSPGSIYPLLSQLTEEAMIRRRDDQRYELTSLGMEEIGMHGHGHRYHSDQGPYTIEGTLSELESYISYLEDVPKDRLSSQADRLGRISERLQGLKESLKR